MVKNLVYGGIAAAGLAGGFMLDRSISNTPYRVDKRIPDIARSTDQRSSYSDKTPAPAGGGVDAAVIMGPIGGAAIGITSMVAAATLVPKDRIWQQHFTGRAAIGATIIGASMATGALISRTVLG